MAGPASYNNLRAKIRQDNYGVSIITGEYFYRRCHKQVDGNLQVHLTTRVFLIFTFYRQRIIVSEQLLSSIPSTHKLLEMWANAQRDGRPAKYRWRPLFNAAKFG